MVSGFEGETAGAIVGRAEVGTAARLGGGVGACVGFGANAAHEVLTVEVAVGAEVGRRVGVKEGVRLVSNVGPFAAIRTHTDPAAACSSKMPFSSGIDVEK